MRERPFSCRRKRRFGTPSIRLTFRGLERPESCAKKNPFPKETLVVTGAVLILKVDNTRKRYDVRIFVRFLGR